MAFWMVGEPHISLYMRDKPLFYNTSRGRQVAFELSFKGTPGRNGQSDTAQPGIFGVGTNWHTPWRSYIQYAGDSDPTASDGEYLVFLGDGSARQYPLERYEALSRTELNLVNGEFILTFNDGSKNVYGQPVTIGTEEYHFLTRKEDVQGNVTQFAYAYTTNVSGVTNSIRLSSVTDPDSQITSFVYTNHTYYSNLLVQVQGPHGLTANLQYNPQGQLTNIVDVVNLASAFKYDSAQRISQLITPYGTNSFSYIQTNAWKGLLIEQLGLRRHLYLEGGTVANVLPSAEVEAMALNSLLVSNSVTATVQTNSFDDLNTFYWGPRQYQNLPSGVRTAIQGGTLDPDTLTTNDFKLGRTRHWLRALGDSSFTNAVASTSLSVERSPSPNDSGATEGLLTWFDYYLGNVGGHIVRESRPSSKAWHEPGKDWFVKLYVRNSIGKLLSSRETYSVLDSSTGSLTNGWRSEHFLHAGNGIDTVLRYTSSGDVSHLISSNIFNEFHQVATNHNALGEMTVYEYNASHQMTKMTRPSGLITEYTYDGNGLLQTVVDKSLSVNLSTNSYTWTNGYIFTHTDERGLTITNSWDALGRITKLTYSDGAFITHTYEKLDQVRTLDRMGFTNSSVYNGFREITQTTDANGQTNSYQYCNCGSLESATDPLGNTTSYTYDNLGRRTRTMFPGSSYQDFTYDLANRLTRMVDNSGVSVTNYFTINDLLFTSSNAAGQITRRIHDDHDRVSESVDQNGVWTGFSYDEIGRLVERVITRTVTMDGLDSYTDESTEHFDYTNNIRGAVASYRASVYTVIWINWLTNIAITPIGPATTYAYDLFGRKTNEVHWDINGVALMTNNFAYNAAGDLVTLSDGKFQTTTWKYDLHGRVTNKLDTTSTELFRYAYDVNGRLISRWSAEKGTTAYSYDAVGNLTLVNYPVSPDITLSYDAVNRLTNMVDAVGTTRYGYTTFGALQSEDGPWADDTVTHSYSANRLGRGFSLVQPNASPWTVAFGYDAASRLSSVTSPAGTFEYEFTSVTNVVTASQLIRRLSLPNGSAITNQFDERGRWLGTTLRSSTGTLLNQHLYTYNDLDQRTKQTRAGGDFVDYGYDDLGQLTSAKGKESGGTTNRLIEQFGYAYDAAGNLNYRTNDALVQTFNVNSLNTLTALTRTTNQTVAGSTFGPATSVTVNGATATRYADSTFGKASIALVNGSNTFTAIAQDSLGRLDTNIVSVYLPATNTFVYDLNGNLRTNITRTFEYDDENQLTRITEPNVWKSEFTYDGAMRMRISKDYEWRAGAWVQSNEVRRVYDGMSVLQKRNSLNIPTLTSTRGKDLSRNLGVAGGIGGLLSLTEHANLSLEHSYYSADGNGNITALVHSNQSVVARYFYDPFGSTLSATGSKTGENQYRFSSKEWHALSGMLYYTYRWYVPELQRWLTRDPIEEEGGINLSTFVFNDSINLADADGLAPGGQGQFPKEQWKQRFPPFFQPPRNPKPPPQTRPINRPPSLSPPNSGRHGAFCQAKKDCDVPVSQQPNKTRLVEDRGKPGKTVVEYEFEVPKPGGGTRTCIIRDDRNGHYFGPNDPQNRGPHFNTESGGHYDYGGASESGH